MAPIQLSLGAEFTDGAKSLGAGLAFGNAKTFGGFGVSYINYDDLDLSATALTVNAGQSIATSSASSVRLCPIVQGTYGIGPNEESPFGTLKTSTLSGAGGLALGGSVAVSPGFSVLPFASAAVVYVRGTVSFDGDSESSSDTGGSLSGGLGLLFGDVFSVRPAISVPVGFEGSSDPVFSISVTIGRRGAR